MIEFMLEKYNQKGNREKLCPNAMKEIPNLYKNETSQIHGFDTNCWSTTLYTIGASDVIKYIDAHEIRNWLIHNAVRISKNNGIKKREFGDILVLEYSGDLNPVHTAIYLGNKLYWHQSEFNGIWEILTLKDIFAGSSYYDECSFYHVKPKPKSKWKTDFDFLMRID